MDAFILNCRPFNPIHLGKSTLESTDVLIHSDTLYSALVHNHVKLFGPEDLPSFHAQFEQGHCRISSAFPCLENQDGNRVFLLPRPENLLDGTGQLEGLDHKALKKVAFISTGLWSMPSEALDMNACFLLGSSMLISKAEAELLGLTSYRKHLHRLNLIGKSSRPKVHARKPNDDNAYFVLTTTDPQRQYLSKSAEGKWIQAHYYFLLDRQEDLHPDRVNACINLLADQGIGGERSSGCGSFLEVVRVQNWAEQHLPKPPNPTFHVGLSMHIPESATAFQNCLRYQLFLRGGNAIRSKATEEEEGYPGFERKQVRMIGEGAVYERYGFTGKIANLRTKADSGHPIWRNGILFTLPY